MVLLAEYREKNERWKLEKQLKEIMIVRFKNRKLSSLTYKSAGLGQEKARKKMIKRRITGADNGL